MKPSEPGHSKYRPDIDGLRALAILSVIGFHAFPAWVPGGFVGVDIFFVISGFLISGILLTNLRDGHFSLTDFYARRVRRIFPALITVLIATLVAGYFLLWLDEYKQLGKHVAGGAGFVINYMLAGEAGYFDTQAETKPLLHLWSLGAEEQFYFFWPLMLWLGWKARRHTGYAITVTLALSFGANIWLSHAHPALDFYALPPRFWELAAGGALAWFFQSGRPLKSRAAMEILSIAGLALILAGDFALTNQMTFPGWLALLPVLGAVALIAAGPQACVNRALLSNRVMIAVGLISYPLYLWHWPLLSFAHILSGEDPARIVRIAMVALSFPLAWATYALIEKPLRKGPLQPRKIFILLALMAVTANLGLAIYLGQGWEWRFADHGAREKKLDSVMLNRQWQNDIRGGVCYLSFPQTKQDAPQCIEQKRPLLFIWGDSHAASLYPGLAFLQATHHFGIAQMTHADCPPLFDIRDPVLRPGCGAMNRDTLGEIARLQPDVVLLAAAWAREDYRLGPDEVFAHIIAVIDAIRQAAPRAHVMVMGEVPRWLSPLPAIYRRSLTFSDTLPPAYSFAHLDPEVVSMERAIAPRLTQAGIDYISLQYYLCNDQGCLTRTGDGIESIAFIDNEHITTTLSRRLAESFAPDLFKSLGLAP